MVETRFDILTRSVVAAASRRRLLAGTSAALLAGLTLVATHEQTPAKKQKKPKQITICVNGQTQKTKKKGFQTRFPGATVGACTTPPPNGTGVTLQDAACPAAGGSPFGTATPEARFAQTFTPMRTGQLVTAQTTIIKVAGSVGDYVATINTVGANGVPTNTVLATTSLPNANVAEGEAVASFTFPTPANVVAGTPLALVLSRTGGQLTLRGATTNPCLGAAFDSPSQTAPFQASGAAIDFDFKTFVRA